MIYRAGWFFTGVVSVILLQSAVVAGFTYAMPVPPLAAINEAVERKHIFRILAPKGMEDHGAVVFDCQPKKYESAFRSGKKP